MATDQASLLLKRQLQGILFLLLFSIILHVLCYSSCMTIHILIVFLLLYSSELNKKPVEGFSAGLVDDDNLFKWEVMVMGPTDSF